MQLKEARAFIIAMMVMAVISCRKPYSPPAISSPGSYLVVEGTINTSGITNVKLSKTVPLSNSNTANPVTGASIIIQSSQGASYPLSEETPGYYQSASLSLDNSQQYRLGITTPGGQEYLSDFEPVVVTPPVDSIGYIVGDNNLQLYVNAHDPTNATKYYRWDYNETWQFHAEYESFFITNGKAIVSRTPQQDIYFCFGSDSSSNIILASTEHLSQGIVYQNILTTIPSTSEKVEMEYSIQVNQYALSGNAYTFWSNLKEDTENLGSIFDPEPSNIAGNIHSTTNTAAPVIGYISVCAVQTKRIFIRSNQLPSTWFPVYPFNCTVDSVYIRSPGGVPEVLIDLIPLGSPVIPTDTFINALHGGPGYLGSERQCVDCTIRGTQVVPPFWPEQLAAASGTMAKKVTKHK